MARTWGELFVVDDGGSDGGATTAEAAPTDEEKGE